MKKLTCAIYTRKSSEEGLEQNFNSLDAQREAGEAFVRSQASEGWKLLATRYDDAGFSGGTMERPALARLLADIEAEKIDVVVVYKIDRLTRSLADFARIVERFDARNVSFVAVTQAFNTHTSMGRLTLNVLLSFAQFEREVTGERIRDKIAASKAKGLWMGGVPPLGYDLPAPGERTLRVNDDEAALVRRIFEEYLAVGSVHRLQAELRHDGVVSKRRVTAAGRTVGGAPLSRGALFHLLGNRIYLGQITHKGAAYQGTHAAIIDAAIFARVQALIASNRTRRDVRRERRVAQAALAGRVYDAAGRAISPSFTYGRGGRVYRYYVSSDLQQGAPRDARTSILRLPAAAFEALVDARLGAALTHCPGPQVSLRSVHVMADRIELHMPAVLRRHLAFPLAKGMSVDFPSSDTMVITAPVSFPLRGGRRSLIAGRRDPSPDRTLVAALRKAHRMLERDREGRPTIGLAPVSPYSGKLLRLAFLDPALQQDIFAGRQPGHINLERLMKSDIPLSWARQRLALRWRSGEPVNRTNPPDTRE